jgi:septum formation protein
MPSPFSPPRHQVVLASASPRRAELLARAEVPFEVIPSQTKEVWDETLLPRQAICAIARAKATDVRRRLDAADSRIVVACDTSVLVDGKAFGKPHDRDDAARMLRALSGRTHQVTSGVCVLSPSFTQASGLKPLGVTVEHDRNGSCLLFSETTDVTFFPLSESDVNGYLDCGEYHDKAGAYGIQGKGGLLVERIEGDYDNVVGLPLARLVRVLASLS